MLLKFGPCFSSEDGVCFRATTVGITAQRARLRRYGNADDDTWTEKTSDDEEEVWYFGQVCAICVQGDALRAQQCFFFCNVGRESASG